MFCTSTFAASFECTRSVEQNCTQAEFSTGAEAQLTAQLKYVYTEEASWVDKKNPCITVRWAILRTFYLKHNEPVAQ